MSNEISFGLGARKDKKDRRDRRLSSIQAPGGLPVSFRLLDDFPPKNQFSRGSCTAQAQAHHKERQEKVQLSARFVMAETKRLEGNSNYGAYTRNTFKVVEKIGACEESLYPEPDAIMPWTEYIDTASIPQNCYQNADLHRNKSYWRIENDIQAIKQAVYQNTNSVVFSIAWYDSFNYPVNGVLNFDTTSKIIGGHAIEDPGWDDKNHWFIIKNSWGLVWGDGGFCYLPYHIFDEVIWDAWISLDIPKEMPVDNYYGQKRTWASFMREQAMAFNPWLYKKIGRLPNNQEIKGLVYGFWEWEAIFRAKYGDVWLSYTKPEAKKKGLIP